MVNKNQVIKDYLENGKSVSEIAKENNCCTCNIYYILKKAGIDCSSNSYIKRIHKDIAKDYVETDLDVSGLAKKYGVSINMVYYALKRTKTKARRKNPSTDDLVQTIIAKLESGYSQSDIAREMGFTRQYINSIVKKHKNGSK